ncbi:MAG: hypothetical protein ACRDDY_02115 [Clostridium sp.]|uniref:hypothetical protein n=1 Tax=Clostridium sp. TaxID=1506 RepID=UPI003EE78936
MGGYTEALEAAGCEVLGYKEYGSYQGDWIAVVKVDGEIGVVEGYYGSCSVCDAFESEFGYSDEDNPDYKDRLAEFGKTYLPAMTFDFVIAKFEKDAAEPWNDEAREIVEDLKEWKAQH